MIYIYIYLYNFIFNYIIIYNYIYMHNYILTYNYIYIHVYYLYILIYIISHNTAYIYIYIYIIIYINYHNSQAGEKSQVSYLRGPTVEKIEMRLISSTVVTSEKVQCKYLSMIPFPLSLIKKVCGKTGAMPSFVGENTFFPGTPKKRMKQIEHDL